jgi:hypothetical protein
MVEIHERSPPILKTSMIGSLGSGAEDRRALIINVKNVDICPWKTMPEIQERPPSTQKTSMAGPL